jgi:hypothetical protein
LLPEPPFFDERRETFPDFFVEEVRLEAAAARNVLLEPLRDDPPFVLREADFVPPRLDERAVEADFVERADDRDVAFEPEREAALRPDFAAVRLVLFEPEREADFVDFAADLRVDFAALLALVRFVAVFLAPDFLALLRAVDLVPLFFAALFVPEVREDFAALLVPVFLAVLFVPDLEPLFFALLFVPDRELDFAAVLEPLFFAADFVPPLLRAPELLLRLPLLFRDEPLRERLLLLDVELVDEPPEPDSFCMVSDLSSVAITASLHGSSRENRHA